MTTRKQWIDATNHKQIHISMIEDYDPLTIDPVKLRTAIADEIEIKGIILKNYGTSDDGSLDSFISEASEGTQRSLNSLEKVKHACTIYQQITNHKTCTDHRILGGTLSS